jgi:hypothetical protein
MRYTFTNPYDRNICTVARSKVIVGCSAMARHHFLHAVLAGTGRYQPVPTADAPRARYPYPLPVPAPRAPSPIVRILAPQAADTPRKGSIYVLSTPDDLALSDFGLLQDC